MMGMNNEQNKKMNNEQMNEQNPTRLPKLCFLSH